MCFPHYRGVGSCKAGIAAESSLSAGGSSGITNFRLWRCAHAVHPSQPGGVSGLRERLAESGKSPKACNTIHGSPIEIPGDIRG